MEEPCSTPDSLCTLSSIMATSPPPIQILSSLFNFLPRVLRLALCGVDCFGEERKLIRRAL